MYMYLMHFRGWQSNDGIIFNGYGHAKLCVVVKLWELQVYVRSRDRLNHISSLTVIVWLLSYILNQ